MEMTSNQVGELDEERVNKGSRDVSKNYSLLLRKRKVYSLRDAVGEKNEAAAPEIVKPNSFRRAVLLTIEGSYLLERRRIVSNSKDRRVPV